MSRKYLFFISGIFLRFIFLISQLNNLFLGLYSLFSAKPTLIFFLNLQELKSLEFCSVKKHDTYDAPIKSKEELIFHVGFRQFIGRYCIFLMSMTFSFFFFPKELVLK